MSYYDVECPYCKAELEIDHDDGYGFEEDEMHFQGCRKCEKTFSYTTSIHYYYEVEKAPCVNGDEPHDWGKVYTSRDDYFLYRCHKCGETDWRKNNEQNNDNLESVEGD